MSRRQPRFRRNNPTLTPTTNNVFQLSILGVLEGQLTVNNFYYQDTGTALTSTSETDLVGTWQTNVQAQYLACISADWTLTSYRCAVISLPSRIPVVVNAAGGTVGLAAAGHEPTTVSQVFSRYSSVRGQSGRGRLYLPAVPTANVSSSSLNAGGQTTAALFAAKLPAVLTGATRTFTPVIVSRRGLAPGAAINLTSPVLTGAFRVLLGTTRRRRIGRGK